MLGVRTTCSPRDRDPRDSEWEMSGGGGSDGGGGGCFGGGGVPFGS